MTAVNWANVGKSYERMLGDSEFAFFPASQTGLGDMFLHTSFRAPKQCLGRSRATVAWAIIRARHPLLMSQVKIGGEDVNTAHFSFTPPVTLEDKLADSERALYFRNETKEDLIFNYMNGPRTLSNEHLSYLVISEPQPSDSTGDLGEYDLLMCAPHFTGDGSSLHQSTHELFSLLSSPKSEAALTEELMSLSNWEQKLPPAFESRLPVPGNAFARAASTINYEKTLEREIGGHTITRAQRGPQRTVLIERSFTEAQTTAILSKCKSNNVTVNHALFALCNIAWGRILPDPSQSTALPMMMYTAINLRAHLLPHPSSSTYWFLALTYFNVVLPAFLPTTPGVFWHRAKSVKAQTRRTTQSPFLPARALEMARIRASRARGTPLPAKSIPPAPPPSVTSLPPAPSAALLGLSLIGNLDAVYTRSAYPSFHLHSVTTASRQKAGGLLLLEHTFAKKLWLHLCWDQNGFAEGQIERFWDGLQSAVEEFLV